MSTSRTTPRRPDQALSATGLSFVKPAPTGLTRYSLLSSPLGTLTVLSDGQGLSGLYLKDARYARPIAPEWVRDDALFLGVKAQLEQYFAGERQVFDLRLSPAGTPFQLQVWQALTAIPYARTSSYVALARAIGRPRSYRAVGNANGHNPISVIVPCHRVIAADGSPGGYAGGPEKKQLLLSLEARCSARPSKVEPSRASGPLEARSR